MIWEGYVYIYIYIYREREREGKKESERYKKIQPNIYVWASVRVSERECVSFNECFKMCNKSEIDR